MGFIGHHENIPGMYATRSPKKQGMCYNFEYSNGSYFFTDIAVILLHSNLFSHHVWVVFWMDRVWSWPSTSEVEGMLSVLPLHNRFI